MLALLDQAEPVVADKAEAVIAGAAAQKLKAVAETKQDIKIAIMEDAGVIVPLPARAVALMYQVLSAMAEGVPISVIPHEAELTTQQAADFLNVSRPYLIKLLDEGKIAHSKTGRHRRVLFKDVAAYKQQSRLARRDALAELAEEARRLDLE